MSVFVVQQAAALSADPESAGAVHQECPQIIPLHRWCVVAIKQGEAHAIEAHQPLLGGDPQVAIGSLSYCRRTALGPPVASPPDGVDVLVDWLIGRQACRSPGRQ